MLREKVVGTLAHPGSNVGIAHEAEADGGELRGGVRRCGRIVFTQQDGIGAVVMFRPKDDGEAEGCGFKHIGELVLKAAPHVGDGGMAIG